MSLNLPQPSGSAKIYATGQSILPLCFSLFKRVWSASADWVIPPKPRPGRKPKVTPQDDLDFENASTSFTFFPLPDAQRSP